MSSAHPATYHCWCRSNTFSRWTLCEFSDRISKCNVVLQIFARRWNLSDFFIGNGISIGNKNDQINRNRIGNGVMGTGENDQSNSHSDTYMYSLTVRLWSKCVQLLVYCTKFLLLLLHQSINQFNSDLAAREPDSKWHAVEIIDKNTKRNKQCAHMYLGVGRDV